MKTGQPSLFDWGDFKRFKRIPDEHVLVSQLFVPYECRFAPALTKS
jgi:hypothetical protein